MKTAILTDTTFSMCNDYLEKNNIFRIPLYVNFENVTFKENDYDDTIIKSIITRIDEHKVLPKTSQPSTNDFITKFEEVKELGYDRILVFTLSSKLSGTFQGATLAANMFNEKNPDLVEVFDSKNVAMAAGFVIREIVRYMNEVDSEIDTKIIHDIVDFYSEHAKTFFSVESLDYLSYGGRISPTVAALGNLFGIKPLLICDQGEIIEHSKVRNSKRVLKTINNAFETVAYEKGYLSVAHCENEKDAKYLQKHLSNAAGEIQVLPITNLGPVISIHTGPGTIAAVWGPLFF